MKKEKKKTRSEQTQNLYKPLHYSPSPSSFQLPAGVDGSPLPLVPPADLTMV